MMCVVFVLCLIVVPLPPGENPFAVKINIYTYIMSDKLTVFSDVGAPRGTQEERWSAVQAPGGCNCKRKNDPS
jgi:hypothetical protein